MTVAIVTSYCGQKHGGTEPQYALLGMQNGAATVEGSVRGMEIQTSPSHHHQHGCPRENTVWGRMLWEVREYYRQKCILVQPL